MKTLLVAALCIAAFAANVSDANDSPTATGAGSHRGHHLTLPLTEDETLAPVARGELLTDAQLRYCLAQPVRIDAVRPLLNRYEPAEVQNFNTLVADFNARCGSYRFKPEDQTEAKLWVEQNRGQIAQTAREAYAAQFPNEARTARTKAATAPATSPAPAAPAPAPATAAAAPPETAAPVTSRDGEIAVTARVAEDPKPVAAPKPATTSERPAVRQAQAPKHTAPETGRPASVPPRPLPGRALNETAKEQAQSPAAVAMAKPAETATTAPIPGESNAAPVVEDNTISKPRTFPNETTAAPAAQPGTPSSAAPSPAKPEKSEAKPLAPALTTETKPAKTTEKPVASAPTPSASPQTAKTQMPETPAQPESKPAKPSKGQKSTTGRKSEQVAAVTPKPEPVAAGPEAALARLTKEIQRAGSQVLPQPANAGTSGDATTQVEVHFAAGGFVRSIVVGESSGSPAHDEQAHAQARATRFPDVPEELRSRDFSVRFPVQFRAAR